MKTLILFLLAALGLLALSGCSYTRYEKVSIDQATFNDAAWKSQAGVGGNADIEATTAPQTDASLTGL